MYRIELSATAYHFLKKTKMPSADLKAIKEGIISLGNNPKPHGCEKLKGFKNDYYRIRVGNYRIVYEIREDGSVLIIIFIGHRREIYRHLR